MGQSKLAAISGAMAVASCATPATQGPTLTTAATTAEAQKQSEYVLQRRLGEMRRVYDVAAKVKVANVASCPAKAPWLGADFATVDDFRKDLQNAARGVVSDRPEPIWIAVGSPAARSGLQLRDVLVAVNGVPAAKGRNASDASVKAILKGLDSGPVSLTVERAGAPVELTVPREDACGYGIYVDDDAEANAFADGRDIHVFRGLLRVVESDDELALVLSHEMAHNTMNHIGKQTRNVAIGALAGALLDAAAAYRGSNTQGVFTKMGAQMTGKAYSQAFEAEADYVGMYYLAAAGFKIDGVEAFWRRMAAEDPKQITMGVSHPSTAARYVAIQATRDEIAEKARSGLPLTPNPKPSGKSPPT